MRRSAYHRLPLLLAPLAVMALLASALHAGFGGPLQAAGRLAVAAKADNLPIKRSSHHLPYFSFVRALRPGS